MKKLFISVFVIALICIAIYFGYSVFWIYQLHAKQNTMGTNLPDHFKEIFSIKRDSNGYFCINGQLKNETDDSFIIDTKATSMARIEKLEKISANYWGSYPMPIKNVYGQQERLPLYEIQNLVVHNKKLYGPLFKGIKETNALYELLYKDVLGKDVLKNFSWKFSLDDGLVTLFSNKDGDMLKSESVGFMKIPNGLNRNIPLDILCMNYREKFEFDLGYQGCLSIEKDLFEELKLKLPCEKYLNERVKGRIDTAFVFNNIDIMIASITIPNCTLCYYPLVNRNLIGVRFSEKLNFILGYQFTVISSVLNEDLYIQKRKNKDMGKGWIVCPNIGFDLNILNGDVYLTMLKIGGKAEKVGLRIGDKILDIDSGAVKLDKNTVMSGITTSYLYKKQQIAVEVERSGKRTTFHIK